MLALVGTVMARSPPGTCRSEMVTAFSARTRFRNRRVFLCGDAAHIWVPMAGYGMNAGIADATNLSWLLAGVLHGWAVPSILDAYEAERLPITEQVSRFAMEHAIALSAQRSAVPDDIEAPGPVGDTVREQVGRAAYDLNVNQYCCGGLNFGYFYDASPIIAYDGEPAPGYTMANFTPSTVPGCRVPHLWLRDGRSLYDALGLARPDLHVAWRGDRMPANPQALLDLITGACAPRSAP